MIGPQPARILTPDWCRYSIVSKKWRMIAQDSRLWAMVSLRPEISGLMIPNMEMLLKLIQNRYLVDTTYLHSVILMIMVIMMMDRFTTNLRYLELPCDLITREVLQELAGRWDHKR